MKKAILLLSVVLTFTSCSKDNDQNSVEPNDDVLIKRIVETLDTSTVEYLYEYNGFKIVSISRKNATTGLLHYTKTYTYTGNLITSMLREWNDDFSTNPDYQETYQYDNQNRLTVHIYGNNKREITYNSNDTVTYNIYQLTGGTYNLQCTGAYLFDTNNNLNRDEIYFSTENERHINYTYDTKNNYHKNIIGLNTSEFGTSHNIITLETYEVHNGIKDSTHVITTYDFQYNADNYPISGTMNNYQSQNFTKTFQYYYE